MQVLITGGTGFLGSHLADLLTRRGHAVTVLRRPTSSTAALDGLDVRYEVGDVADASSVRRAVAGHDIVIHAATGVSGHGTRLESHALNVEGARSVVPACLREGVKRLVHVSSIAAIGIPSDATPADEDFAFNLERSKLHYYVSKHRAEDVVREGMAEGLDAVIVNPGSLWGPFGEVYRGSEIVRSVRGARRLRISPGGVCIAHVDDVAVGILSAMEGGASGERYILGGDNLTYRDWMTMIAAALGVRPRFVPYLAVVSESLATALRPVASLHPRLYGPYLRAYVAGRYAFYDSSKAAHALGFAPRSFGAILDECIRALSARS